MGDGRLAMLAAIESGDAPRVRELVSADPTLASVRDDHGVSVLLLARYRRDGDLLAAVRAADAPLDAFDAAALGEAGSLARLLAADPAAARAWSGDGFTALHLAAFFGDAGVARLLLDAGADPDAVSRNVMAVRPLHSAVAGGRGDVALALIAAGAEPDARQRHGWTPLHGAAAHGMADVVEALLDAGADPRAVSDDGLDAARLADDAAHAALAERLRKAAAARGQRRAR